MSKMLSSFNIRLNQIIFYINSKKNQHFDQTILKNIFSINIKFF